MKTCLLVFLCSWLALSAAMFLGPYRVAKDGKDYTYWSWVETVRTPDGPRQQTVCYLGELNSSAQARWLKTVEVFNEHGERRQWKLSPSDIAPPENDPDVAQVWVKKIRLERARQFGNCFLGLELWKGLGLDRFWKGFVGGESVEVPWSRVAALLAIHRWCAQSRVDQFQGADAGAKIAACIAALPASGGTCDATMLTGPQNIGQLRIAHSKVQVLLGTGTYKVAEGIDIEADGVVIQGISGTIIQKTGKGFAILLSGAGHVISRTTLDHLHLVGDPSTFNGGIGVAIHPGCGADFVTIENVVVDSFGQYGIIVSGKVNDLTVRNVRAVNHGSPDAAWPMIGIAIDPKTHSERLVMDNVFSEIDHSNGKASAAIKVQNFRTATVTNLTAVGGTEETLSVAGIGDLTASNWTIRGGLPEIRVSA